MMFRLLRTLYFDRLMRDITEWEAADLRANTRTLMRRYRATGGLTSPGPRK